jgi:hypothetical protein
MSSEMSEILRFGAKSEFFPATKDFHRYLSREAGATGLDRKMAVTQRHNSGRALCRVRAVEDNRSFRGPPYGDQLQIVRLEPH